MSPPTITGRLQAGVLARLSAHGPTAFPDLAAALGTSNGALSQQLQRLEALELIRLERGFISRRPRTLAAITPSGRAAYAAYLDRAMRLAEGDGAD